MEDGVYEDEDGSSAVADWDDKRRESATADSPHEESRPNSPARHCEFHFLK